MALRANVVLYASLGWNNHEIAMQLGVSVKTVRKWRRRYSHDGMEGLYDEPRSGRPFVFDSAARTELFSAVVGPPPEPYAAWSLDLLAKRLVDGKFVKTISIETVSYWLRTADLKPHRVRGWLNSQDPDFRVKRDAILELYRNPPKDGVLLSVDEKTGIQALERVRKEQPERRGQRRRIEWEYKRHGTVNLISSFNVATGQIVSEILEGKNDSDAFINFLRKLMEEIHPKDKIYLILDNGTTHVSHKTRNFFEENKRLVPVFTPKHASWLNQIEMWFSVLSRHALRKVSFPSLGELRERIEAYIGLHNRELAMPYEWSTNGKPLKGASAKQRRRLRNLPKELRKAA
jgi:transposase